MPASAPCENGVCGVPRKASYYVEGAVVVPIADGTETDEISMYSCEAHLTERIAQLHRGTFDTVEIKTTWLRDITWEECRMPYTFRAAREAYDMYGKDYADYVERHTQELVNKGCDVADRSLSEALIGNDSN